MNNIDLPTLEGIYEAEKTLSSIIKPTPLQKNIRLSQKYNANIYLKREDLQCVRSYKIRGSYNKIFNLSPELKKKGIICSSAGNHAQGVAYSSNLLKVKAKIFIPKFTSYQKQENIKMFGNGYVDIELYGDTFDETNEKAKYYACKTGMVLIPPFDDKKIIEGQASVGLEIHRQADFLIDTIIVPVGGGGLISGIGTVFQHLSPQTKIIGVEPQGAPSMQQSLKNKQVYKLKSINRFVDGAAVKEIGKLNFTICEKFLKEEDMFCIPEGKICTTILELYNRDAIVAEPAGALSITALDNIKQKIRKKNIVCVLSGGNNDIDRVEEIKELSLLHEGLKHYFIINLPQRPGALKEFLNNNTLEKDDDIVYFEYVKKINRGKGPVLIGIETKTKKSAKKLKDNMIHSSYSVERIKGKELISLLF